MRKFEYFLAVLIVFTSISHAQGNWLPRGEGVQNEWIDGVDVFAFERGFLDNESINIKNGIIEFDLKSGGERAFFYIYFRQQATGEAEEVYLRTHKSNAPDTLQYSPVVQGRSAWQIYHGDRGTASATLDEDTWTKIKLKFVADSLSVWVGESAEPVMENVKLALPISAGSISLRGNIPRASHAVLSGVVRNIKVTNLNEGENDTRTLVEPLDTAQGVVKQYRVSEAFAADKSPYNRLPPVSFDTSNQWARTDDYGVLQLLMHRQIPKDTRSWATLAEIQLHSDKDMQCQINFGFSDAISVLLDGNPLAHADASYRYSNNRQEGLLHARQLSVFAPLKAGKHRLQLIVADSFGGWGVRTELSQCPGVRVISENSRDT